MSISVSLSNIVLEILARAPRQARKIKGVRIGKQEVKLSLFEDHTIHYIEDHQNSIEWLLGIINIFSKVAGCKVNT